MYTPAQSTEISIIIITAILLLLTTFIISMLFYYQKRQFSYQNELENIKSEFEKATLTTQLEIQEQTIQQISRDIHDNINLSLTLAKLQLNTLEIKYEQKETEKISHSIELITNSIDDLRSLSRSMNSDTLKEQGLIYAIEQELEKFKKIEHLESIIIVEGDSVYMEFQKELFIFRIIQEALNNILKHSRASVIKLKLTYTQNSLSVEISDNGIGIEKSLSETENKRINSSGLINMKKRATLIGGSFFFQSFPGVGTSVIINVPY